MSERPSGIIKVADLGVSRVLGRDEEEHLTFVGTESYMSDAAENLIPPSERAKPHLQRERLCLRLFAGVRKGSSLPRFGQKPTGDLLSRQVEFRKRSLGNLQAKPFALSH